MGGSAVLQCGRVLGIHQDRQDDNMPGQRKKWTKDIVLVSFYLGHDLLQFAISDVLGNLNGAHQNDYS